MNRTRTLALVGLSGLFGLVFFSGCELLDELDDSSSSTEDGGADDGGAEDGGTEDGGTADGGSEDGGSEDGGSEDGGSEDGGSADGGSEDGGTEDGGAEDTTSEFRIGNIGTLDSAEVVITSEDGTELLREVADPSSVVDYTEFEAGPATVSVIVDGAEVWTDPNGVYAASLSYTMVVTETGGVIVKQDNYADIADEEIRLNLTNLDSETTTGWVGPKVDDAYVEELGFELSPNAEVIGLVPADADVLRAEAVWPVGSGSYLADWDIQDMAVYNAGSLVYAYIDIDGACSLADYEAGEFDCDVLFAVINDDATVSYFDQAEFGWPVD